MELISDAGFEFRAFEVILSSSNTLETITRVFNLIAKRDPLEENLIDKWAMEALAYLIFGTESRENKSVYRFNQKILFIVDRLVNLRFIDKRFYEKECSLDSERIVLFGISYTIYKFVNVCRIMSLLNMQQHVNLKYALGYYNSNFKDSAYFGIDHCYCPGIWSKENWSGEIGECLSQIQSSVNDSVLDQRILIVIKRRTSRSSLGKNPGPREFERSLLLASSLSMLPPETDENETIINATREGIKKDKKEVYKNDKLLVLDVLENIMLRVKKECKRLADLDVDWASMHIQLNEHVFRPSQNLIDLHLLIVDAEFIDSTLSLTTTSLEDVILGIPNRIEQHRILKNRGALLFATMVIRRKFVDRLCQNAYFFHRLDEYDKKQAELRKNIHHDNDLKKLDKRNIFTVFSNIQEYYTIRIYRTWYPSPKEDSILLSGNDYILKLLESKRPLQLEKETILYVLKNVSRILINDFEFKDGRMSSGDILESLRSGVHDAAEFAKEKLGAISSEKKRVALNAVDFEPYTNTIWKNRAHKIATDILPGKYPLFVAFLVIRKTLGQRYKNDTVKEKIALIDEIKKSLRTDSENMYTNCLLDLAKELI